MPANRRQRAVAGCIALAAGGVAQPLSAGVGATLPERLYQLAFGSYYMETTGVDLEYAALGSRRGSCRAMDWRNECDPDDGAEPRVPVWAASDALLSSSDYADYSDLQMYPTVAAAVVPVYNLPNARSSDPVLVLTPEVLSRIFRSAITHWNDSSISALNPELAGSGKLPAERIRLVVREAGSGTSEIFTRALSSFDASFSLEIGVSATPNWTSPDALVCSTNQGISSCVLETSYAMGYAVLGEARAFNVPFASLLMDPIRQPVVASAESLSAALTELGVPFGNNGDVADRLTADVHGAQGPVAWPIAGLTYLVMRKTTLLSGGGSCEALGVTVAFWDWFYSSDQVAELALAHGYALLPLDVRDFVARTLREGVTCDGAPVYSKEKPVPLRGGGPDAYGEALLLLQLTYEAELETVTGLKNDLSVAYTAAGPGDSLDILSSGAIEYALTPAGALAESPLSAESWVEIPFASIALALVWSPCGVAPCWAENQTLTFDVATITALVNGSLTRWRDARLVALNPWLDAEPHASTIGVHREISLVGEGADSHAIQQLLRLLQTADPAANVGVFGEGGRAHITASVHETAAAVMGTPFSIGIMPLTRPLPEPLSRATLISPADSLRAVLPSADSLATCLSAWDENGIVTHVALAHQPTSCYALMYDVGIVTPRTYSGDNCTKGEVVIRFFNWAREAGQQRAIQSREMSPLAAVVPLLVQKALESPSCTGSGPVLYLHIEQNSLGSALHGIVYTVAGLFCFFLLWFHAWAHVHRSNMYIKSSQLTFIRIMTLGLLLTLSAGFALPRDHDDEYPDFSVPVGERGRYPQLDKSCQAEIWLYFLGVTITFSALTAKLWRATKVLVNPTMRDVKVPARNFLLLVGCLTCATVVILSVWTSVDPPYFRLSIHPPNAEGIEMWYGTCEYLPSGHAVFPVLLITLLGCVLAFASYLCYLTWKLNPIYAESSGIALTIFASVISHIIGLILGDLSYPFRRAGGSTVTFFFAKWLAPLITCSTIIAVLYMPRVFLWMKHKKKRHATFPGSGNEVSSVAMGRKNSDLSSEEEAGGGHSVSLGSLRLAARALGAIGAGAGGGVAAAPVDEAASIHGSTREARRHKGYIHELEVSLAQCQAELLDARDDLTELRDRNNNLRDELSTLRQELLEAQNQHHSGSGRNSQASQSEPSHRSEG